PGVPDQVAQALGGGAGELDRGDHHDGGAGGGAQAAEHEGQGAGQHHEAEAVQAGGAVGGAGLEQLAVDRPHPGDGVDLHDEERRDEHGDHLGQLGGPEIISRIGKMAIFGSGYNAANSGPKAALTGRKAPISSPTAIPATAPRPPPTSRRSRVGQVWDHSSPSSAISVAAAAIRLGGGKNRGSMIWKRAVSSHSASNSTGVRTDSRR